MSFESVYRSREGIREIEKIVGFCMSLVIKNQYEVNLYESQESIDNFYKYDMAYSGLDNVSDYSDLISDNTLSSYIKIQLQKSPYNYNDDIIDYLFGTPLDTLMKYSNTSYVISFLTELRKCRILFYEEKNIYYRQFLGIPNTVDDIVLVRNYDSSDPDAKIPAHKIHPDNYPETYTYFILREQINSVIAQYPNLVYLRFINTNNTPYYLYNLPNYSIIQYDKKTLNNKEYSYFLESFNRARAQVILDYLDGFDSRFPTYNIMMICNLLYFSVLNYTNSYLEQYSVRDYTEENINDILDSNGYSRLKDISDLELKRKVVLNLDELTANKGTEYVIQLILNNILDSNNNEINRIYLEKQYTTDDDYAISINTSKSLEDSIRLVFKESVYASQNQLSGNNDLYHEYTDFVIQDDYWGGVIGDSYETKTAKQEALRKELLKKDFNSILTRYITLTRTVDILAVQRETADLLYIMLYRAMEGNLDIFYEQKFALLDFECTAAGLFGALCWLQQMKFSEKDDSTGESVDEVADIIIKNDCLLNSTTIFRKFGDMTEVLKTGEFEIIDGEVVEDITPGFFNILVRDLLENEGSLGVVKIKDIISYDTIITNIDNPNENGRREETYEDFFIRYRYYDDEGNFLGEVTEQTTIGELINDYEPQANPLLHKITQKLAKSSDYREYKAWKYIYSLNFKNNSFSNIFVGFDRYSDFMRRYESDSLISFIYNNRIVDSNGNIVLENVCSLINLIKEYFENWVTVNVNDKIFTEFGNSNNDTYIADMTLLFNEFISVYSELYKVNYQLEIEGDSVFKLQLFYNPIFVYMSDEFREYISLTHSLFQSITQETSFDLNLIHVLTGNSYEYIKEVINGELTLDENGFVITNPFDYEYVLSIIQNIYHKLVFKHDINMKVTSVLPEEKMFLKHELKQL